MEKKKKYIMPDIEVIEVCSEGLMQDILPGSWDVDGKKEGDIIEGDPPPKKSGENRQWSNTLWDEEEW